MMNRVFILLFFSFRMVLAQPGANDQLFWPKPPEKARIKFLYSFSCKQDLGIKKSFWHKIADFLFGEEHEFDRLARPQGITVDAGGRIYVTDMGARGVHVFDFAKKEYQLFQGTSEQHFVSPVSVAVGDNGTRYVSDSELNTVFIFDADWGYRYSIRNGLQRPTGIWFNEGLLYVVDTGLNQIVVFDANGVEQRRFGKRGVERGEFNYPVYLCLAHPSESSAQTRMYVVDALNFRLQILQSDGAFQSMFGILGDGFGRFARPKGVALDSEGHIYVADALFDVIQIFDQRGEILMAFGGSGSAAGRFSLPAGIAMDSNDRLYVVDSGNRRIQVFQYLK